MPAAIATGLAGLVGLLLDGFAPPRVVPSLLFLIATALIYSQHQEARPQPVSVRRPTLMQVIFGAGVVAQLAIVVPYLAIGLIVPPWGLVVFFGIWGGMLALLLRFGRTNPWLVPFIPITTYFILARLLEVGGSMLGWTP